MKEFVKYDIRYESFLCYLNRLFFSFNNMIFLYETLLENCNFVYLAELQVLFSIYTLCDFSSVLF